MDATSTIATARPAAPLTPRTTYKLRVVGTVTSATGVPLGGGDFTHAAGFQITCAGKLVISQIYGGGSASGGVFKDDFIELHNSGGAPVDLTGLAIQSTSRGTLNFWAMHTLPSAIIPPGGYFLLKEGNGQSMQNDLPAPDDSGSLVVSGTAGGKVALTLSILPLFSDSCPLTSVPAPTMLDFVGYSTSTGVAPDCFEGITAPTAAVTNSKAVLRNDGGCGDANDNTADFTVATPAPRNSASPVHVCACPN
jgi:hypothetical protein